MALWLSIFITLAIRSREGVFSSTGWPGKHHWCWKTKGLLLPSQAATSKPFSFSAVTAAHTHTQLLLRYHQPWPRSELPDSGYNCLLQTQGRQLSKRVFIYTQLMLCAQQKRCRKHHERFCAAHYARGRVRLQPTISSCLHFSQKMPIWGEVQIWDENISKLIHCKKCFRSRIEIYVSQNSHSPD